ncbi:hypothetical protein GCM10022389_11800 [Flavobacterium cheonanense]|uniref:Polysaccharide chain length determinant N-terminal domain-containing protein n=1 Tax=Flavobacterium cheonanense TaxID=706183 RepID=A0ABP7VJL4_9FLAO
MSTNSQNNDNQEIDLSDISKKIGGLYDAVLMSIFNMILFFKRKALILGLLFIIGAVLGFFLDSNKNYNSQIIVAPSGGVDYLYSKVDLIKSRLSEKDETFFKSIGIINSDKIQNIKIEPIVDLYNFVNNNTAIASNAQNTQNFEVIKLLAESNDINKVIEDELTSKNYPYHSLLISSNGRIESDDIIKPLLKYLNTDDYMSQISKINKENILIKMKKNEEEIVQIDSLISVISKNISNNNKSNNLIYNNENSEINAMFELKNKLISEIASQKMQLVKIETFIKDISITPNIINNKGTNGKMKLILPILFISLFVFISLFLAFYKNQSTKTK